MTLPPRRLAILGATGSIGTQAIEVVRGLRARGEPFEIKVLAAGRRVEELSSLAREFQVELVCVAGPEEAARARALLPKGIKVVCGPEGLMQAAAWPGVDLVLNALVGARGLRATLAALQAGKTLALANKESLVVGGELVLAASRPGQIIPVDSEHAALMQLFSGVRREELARAWITASGGPFRDRRPEELWEVTPEQALAHPTWRMGPRITVDSATLVNKAFEVIEARYLFGLEWEEIGVVLHPQSIVHALLELSDGSLLAQLAPPDMRIPIRAALVHPARLPPPPARLTLPRLSLSFFELPRDRFPAFWAVLEAGRKGGTAPAAANAADEVLVDAFLSRRIPFPTIAEGIEEVLSRHSPAPCELSAVEEADAWAREEARRFVERKAGPT
ncbi:1-deoxy-D-xylulose-5-phosphate reductoisomerase [Candidatus Bipolaricaulota bacterium]|nr:1-deoxy-D-xylulose-5-phosphate reductoisomerase [Candidatus Bipolaricaulota bacterium]